MKYFEKEIGKEELENLLKLDSVVERRKFDIKMRQFGLENLAISKHFCNLE